MLTQISAKLLFPATIANQCYRMLISMAEITQKVEA